MAKNQSALRDRLLWVGGGQSLAMIECLQPACSRLSHPGRPKCIVSYRSYSLSVLSLPETKRQWSLEVNHERYLKDTDVERQLTLESYGYRFLRINRFNLGADPVVTLDERLAKLVELATGEQGSQLLDRLRAQAKGIAAKEMKECSRCKNIRPLKGFFDLALKRGEGGYGRVCLVCKGSGK